MCRGCCKLTSNLLFLVVAILDAGKEDGGLVGKDEAVLLEVLVTGIKHSIQHALVEEEITHPLGDDDVHFGEGQLNLLHLALNQSDFI